MKRNENQDKIVLTDGQKATLADALAVATEQMYANGTIAERLGDHYTAALCRGRAKDYQDLLVVAPDVVRVAVTVEAPSFLYAVDA